MSIIRGLLLWVLVGSSVTALGKDAYLSMVYSNAIDHTLPFEIFSRGEWSPDPKARFVKLHLYFDEPIAVRGIEIDSCGTLASDELSIFFNFDQWLLSLNDKLEGEVPEALYPTRRGSVLVLSNLGKSVDVRSLTFNFEHNRAFRICGIKLLDPMNRPYTVKTPQLVRGTVTADSVLSPPTAYDPLYLFDSRFEYGWASNGKAENVSLSFAFDTPRRVEKIRVWNGYQRSVTHYLSNSRAQRVHLSGDDGYSADITLDDRLGSQVVSLPTPFTGRKLMMTAVKSVEGSHYQDLVVSEMRFFDGDDWFMVDPSARLQQSSADNRAAFA